MCCVCLLRNLDLSVEANSIAPEIRGGLRRYRVEKLSTVLFVVEEDPAAY